MMNNDPINELFSRLRDSAAVRKSVGEAKVDVDRVVRSVETVVPITAKAEQAIDQFEALRAEFTSAAASEADEREALITRLTELEAELARNESERLRLSTALSERIGADEARWEPERLRKSVSDVLTGALRDAGHENSSRLARAISPHIVNTIQKEIQNSHGAIIDALSPRIGALIAKSVETAVEELRENVDNALPLDRWIAHAKARLTGGSVVGQLTPSEPFEVLDAFLIERGSGVLLAHQSIDGAEEDAPDDDLVAGMLAALDAFARDVFGSSGIGSLKRMTLEDGQIYLCASETKIVAVRGRGDVTPARERELENYLEAALARSADDELSMDAIPSLLDESDGELIVSGATRNAGPSPFKILTGIIGGIAAIFALFWLHGGLETLRVDRAASQIEARITALSALRGYPIEVLPDTDQKRLLIRGLVPDAQAGAQLRRILHEPALAIPLDIVLPVAGRRLEQI